MKPAVRTAAAFLYATGNMPKGIHWRTRSELSDLAPFTPGARRLAGLDLSAHVLKAEHLDAVRSHPLAQAHDFLTGAGFHLSNDYQREGRSVAYQSRENDDSAHAWRDGGGSVWVKRASVPFNLSLTFTAGTVAAYLAAMRAPSGTPAPGAERTWTAWAALARELVKEGHNRPDLWREEVARVMFNLGKGPVAYAVFAVRSHYGDHS